MKSRFAAGIQLEGGLLAVCLLNDASTVSAADCNQPWKSGVKFTHNIMITHTQEKNG